MWDKESILKCLDITFVFFFTHLTRRMKLNLRRFLAIFKLL